jgi:peptidoglycan/xylan/chitin deacetylase (PgdA/CDA1 family)
MVGYSRCGIENRDSLAMLKQLFALASPQGPKARLTILIFHRVLPAPDPLLARTVHAELFEQICSWMKRWFNVIALDEAVERLKNGTLPSRAACISFDDGYADNYHVALPILSRVGLSATFFISTGFLDGGRMWNDTVVESVRLCQTPELDLSPLELGLYKLGSWAERRQAVSGIIQKIKYLPIQERKNVTESIAQLAKVTLPAHLMMTSQEVRLMRQAGMQIGAHTVSHPILAKLTLEQAQQEILDSKLKLEEILGERVGLFAYPNGKPTEDYLPHNVDLVRTLGFDAAVSTAWGASRQGDDVFQVRRFSPWDTSKLRFGFRLLTNLFRRD